MGWVCDVDVVDFRAFDIIIQFDYIRIGDGHCGLLLHHRRKNAYFGLWLATILLIVGAERKLLATLFARFAFRFILINHVEEYEYIYLQ